MNEGLDQYVQAALASGEQRDAVRQALLAKGWKPQEVEDALVRLGGGAPVASAHRDSQTTRTNRFAVWSPLMVLVAVVAFFVWSPLVPIALFVGIVFGVLGLHSQHTVLAVLGLVLNILVSFFVGVIVYGMVHMYTTHTKWLTNEPLTEQELLDYGIVGEGDVLE